MLQTLFVVLIVLAAAGYAAFVLLPATTRRKLGLRAAAALGGPRAGGWAGRLASAFARSANTSSGTCSGCPASTLTPAERDAKHRT